MNRSLSILLTLIAVTVYGVALVPAPAAAQNKDSGVTLKKDGDIVVLTPHDPEKTYLVLGYPRDAKGQKPAGGASRLLPYLLGEQRFPAKEYSKIVVIEIRLLNDVDLLPEPSGLQLVENAQLAEGSKLGWDPQWVLEPCLLFGICDKPPGPPPPLTYLLRAYSAATRGML